MILSLFDMLKENSPCRLSFLRIQVCPPEEFQHIVWEDPQLRELVKEVFPQCLEMRHGRSSEPGTEKELFPGELGGFLGHGGTPKWMVCFCENPSINMDDLVNGYVKMVFVH